MNWLVAFVLTCAVEFAVVLLVAPRPQRLRVAVDSLAANLFTHPLAYWLVTHGHAGFWPVEGAVALVEAGIYVAVSRLCVLRAVAVSCVANGITLALSFVL